MGPLTGVGCRWAGSTSCLGTPLIPAPCWQGPWGKAGADWQTHGGGAFRCQGGHAALSQHFHPRSARSRKSNSAVTLGTYPKIHHHFGTAAPQQARGRVGAQWGGGRRQVGRVGAAVPDPTLGSVRLALAAALGSASVLCLPPLLLLAPSPLPHCSGLFPRLFSSAPARGSPICWGPACRARSSPGTPAAGLSAELSFPSCHPALPTLGPRLPRCGGQGTVG